MELTDQAVALFQKLVHGPEAQALLCEEQRQVVARRRALSEERSELRQKAAALVEAHEPTRAKAVKIVRERAAALEQANASLAALARAHRAALAPIDRRLQQIESELFNSRPAAAIAAFEREQHDALLATYKASRIIRSRDIADRPVVTWSNRFSVERRAEAIVRAIETARALAAEALDDEELETQFQKIRDELPAVEEIPGHVEEFLWLPRWPNGTLRA